MVEALFKEMCFWKTIYVAGRALTFLKHMTHFIYQRQKFTSERDLLIKRVCLWGEKYTKLENFIETRQVEKFIFERALSQNSLIYGWMTWLFFK